MVALSSFSRVRALRIGLGMRTLRGAAGVFA
jgi:hypothetical protein